ncbi:MAG TPA: glycosyltransferase [Caldilinea sp.]|nr:glycosyltransferase [Caldilinea sp.]
MKILIITPQLPYPPRQGTTIRNYNLIRGLAAHHAVDLLTFLAPGETLAADNPLLELCGRVACVEQPARTTADRIRATATTLTPDMGLRLESPAMHALVRAWCAATKYDVVQVEGIELAQYGMAAAGRRIAPERPALVFDDHNCEYLLQQRNAFTDLRRVRRWPAAAYSLVQWQKLRRYEAAILQASDVALAVSEADRRALAPLAGDTPLTVISNGIDTEAYKPQPAVAPSSTNLVFTGKMDYRPNIDAVLWFAHEVLPLIVVQEPDARFQIVGMNPHARLDVLRGQPNIEITGAVDDTRPYIRSAAAYVIPMRIGGGTRFKALEAMACGAPIVSTTLGVEGIGATDGQELLLADAPDAFAAAVVRLLRDGREGGAVRRRLGEYGRRFVEATYSWDHIIPQLESVLAATARKS